MRLCKKAGVALWLALQMLFALHYVCADELFDITALDAVICLKVSRDGVVEVTEDWDVSFPGDSDYHGFYRYIPLKGFDSREIILKSFKSVSPIADSYRDGNNFVIMFGNKDVVVHGIRHYSFHYVQDIGPYESRSGDVFLFNLLGDGFDMDIEKFTYSVEFESPVRSADVYFGKFGSSDRQTCRVSEDGKKVTGSVIGIPKNHYVTCSIGLGEGYYSGARDLAPFFALRRILRLGAVLASFASLAYALTCFLRSRSGGKGNLLVKTIQFTAPDSMNPMEIGYLYDGKIGAKELCAGIYHLVSLGYADMDERANAKKTEKREIWLTKKTGTDLMKLKRDERLLLESYFSDSESVPLNKPGSAFPEAASSIKAYVSSKYSNPKFKYSGTSAYVKGFAVALAHLLAFCVFAVLSGTEVSQVMPFVILSLFQTAFVSLLMRNAADSNEKSGMTAFVCCLAAVIYLALSAAMTFVLKDLFDYVRINLFVLLLFLLVQLAVLVLNSFMLQKSRKYLDLLGKVLGFRDYIATAEIDRMDTTLVTLEDFKSYIDLMPYAIAFNLEDVWAKKVTAAKDRFGNRLESHRSPVFLSPFLFSGGGHASLSKSAGADMRMAIGRKISSSSARSAGNTIKGGMRHSGGFSGGGGGFSGGGGGGW